MPKKYIHVLKGPKYPVDKRAIKLREFNWNKMPVVSVVNPPSKRSAKHDRVAIKYCRTHDIKPKTLDVTGLHSAGLVSRFK